MEKNKLNWRSFVRDDAVAVQWNHPSTPAYYVLDHKGIIRHKWVGNPGERAIDMALDRLIAEAERDAKGR